MKKLLFFLSMYSMVFSNISNFNDSPLKKEDTNNFEVISTKYTYFHANNDTKNKNIFKNLMYKNNNKKAKIIDDNIKRTEEIFSRIFKTEKNLVPKIIKYIYFEPTETKDKYLLNEQLKNIMIAHNANENAMIYIKNSKNANYFINKLTLSGRKKYIILLNNDNKEIFKQIDEQIYRDYKKKKFNLTEVRVLLITPSSTIKENLSLAYAIFNKDKEGVEIEDFSYLDVNRIFLESTTLDTRLKTFKEMINGIY